MTILDGLKRLGSKSILFKQEAVKGGPKARGGITKIGQGGTLDPLADGVLGELELKGGDVSSKLTRFPPGSLLGS